MHILVITHYYAPDSGAAANRLTRLAVQLQQRGHQVTVLTTMPHYPGGVIPPAYRRRWTVIEERDGVRVVQVWLWTSTSPGIRQRLLSQLSFMLTCSIRGLLLRRPDIILIENQPVFTAAAGWLISRIKRRPYVVNVSDYWPEYLYVSGTVKRTSLIYRLFKALTNLTQRHAARIVILWPGLREGIEQRLKTPPPIHLIYNAVDLDRFASVDERCFREHLQIGNARLVLFVGVLGPHIDLTTMLEAVRQFQGRDDVRFVFAGAGAQKAQLDATLSQPEFAHCIAIDWLPAEDMPALWAASTVTFWALHDNPLDKLRFQAKLYEALASGTPAVVAVNGFMGDFLNSTQTGLAVPPGDALALAAAVDELLSNTELYDAMRQRAHQYAAEHLQAAHQADAYEKVLQLAAP